MPKVLIYLPVLQINSFGQRKITFKKFVEGDMLGFLPVSNLPLPAEEKYRESCANAWQEILEHLGFFHLYINYHRSDKQLVIARFARKVNSPKRGVKLVEFYVDMKGDMENLVEFMNALSKGESRVQERGGSKEVIKFKLPYEYFIK